MSTQQITKIYDGLDLSGATSGVVYIPIVEAGTIKKIIIKSDLAVSGASAVFAMKINGVSVPAGAATITVGNKIVTVSGLSIAVAVNDEITFDLSSGAVSSPVSVSIFVDDGTTTPASADVQIFTTTGANTWTKPSGAKTVEVYLISAGGGGGAGRKGATATQRSGGGGGGAGSAAYNTFLASILGATETVTVGAGGAGGASQTTNSTNGAAGSDGGATKFGNWLQASSLGTAGGAGTSGGVAVAGGATNSSFNVTASSVANSGKGGDGGRGNGSAGSAIGGSPFLPTGGGGGAGLSTGNSSDTAGAGGSIGISNGTGYGALVNASGGGTVGTPAGTIGTTIAANSFTGGTGGGGGYASSTGNAGAGGAGGAYGAGGGGGGAAQDSVGNSGAGGAGAQGIAIVISYF